MVIPPAKTGREKTSRMAVKKILQINKGRDSQVIIAERRFIMVQRKLIDPPMEEAPAMCILKMAKSTLFPGCPTKSLRGG